jgi:hypothetical protein
MAPGKLVPLHSHADPECFYLLRSEIEVFVVDDAPKWRTIEELENWAPPATAPLGEGSTWAMRLVGFAGIGLFRLPSIPKKNTYGKQRWRRTTCDIETRVLDARSMGR